MKGRMAIPDPPEEGDLRVWWVPQVPMQRFFVPVDSIKDAKLVLKMLAEYDQFQFENKVKGDYANAGGLEVFENGEWSEWADEDGNNIDDVEER